MEKPYSIGLDIGTNSVGWAVIDDDLKLIRKNMRIFGNTDKNKIKKNFWGVRLFDEGKTAEDRRLKRTTRRRYSRRKYRIKELQKLFANEINQVDDNFFARIHDSFLIEDQKRYSKYPIFGNLEMEKNYHQKFPTIYHLRKYLADVNEQSDVRLIYTALAHIIKFRGHFLIEGELNAENTSIAKNFEEFVLAFSSVFPDEKLNFNSTNLEMIVLILQAKKSRSRKAEEVLALFDGQKSTGVFSQFLKLIVGNLANFKKSFDMLEDQKLQLSKEEYEENLEGLLALIGDDYADVFVSAKNVYDAIELSSVIASDGVPTRAKLSSQMVKFYDEHNEDLGKLKIFVRKELPEDFDEIFKDSTKDGYAGYIDGKASQEDFYKYLKKKLNYIEGADYFIEKMNREMFLRKQRSFYNGVIPHQIHLYELRAIINNQKQFYPFLKEIADKIEKLLTFRIPYYVGPLAQGQSDFAWIKRKEGQPITPYNFKEIVDENASATKFIEKMINHDTYFPDEFVLPRHSILYEKFIAFNELTKVTYIDDQGKQNQFSSEDKLDIFESLFLTKRKVTHKQLVNYLKNVMQIENPSLKGIEEEFNASYGTYHDLIKIEGMEELLKDDSKTEVLEEIIKILTIFEDRQMRFKQLEQYSDLLSEKTRKQLARKHYTGWGRFSAKLINGIYDKESHKTILEFLINDDGAKYNRNFMQLINDSSLSFKQKIEDTQKIDQEESLLDLVSNLTGSPAIKKGILQSLKIVQEIIEIMGYKPTEVVIEMARENQTSQVGRSRSLQRYKKLETAINDLNSSILKDEPTTNEALKKDRLYLYYLQNGKDMYTGEELDIQKLSHYDIDHIIPQSFTTDDSISNIVLVSSTKNRGKSDDVPSIEVVQKQKFFWKNLLKAGLIDERKFNNLTKAERRGLTDDDKAHFINRQLVETRQITKHVARILDSSLNKKRDDNNKVIRDVRIITLKSALTSQFRREFQLYKVREVNDYHHAHDAYLNAVIAKKLLKVYPRLAPEFVYGEFLKFNRIKENKATVRKQHMTNLMKFFNNKDLIVNEDGESLWNKNKDMKTIRNTLSSNQMNIVKKVEEQTGGFSKESILPKGNSSKLIPRKSKWDTKKYGGFDSPIVAYSIAFTFEKGSKKKTTKSILGITIMQKNLFEKDQISFLENIGYKNPKIYAQMPKYSLLEFSDGRRRLLASASELQKGNQMTFNNNHYTFLYHLKHFDEIAYPKSVDYVAKNQKMFDDIIKQIERFADKYTLAENNLEAIKSLYEENKNVELKIKAEAFISLLTFNAFGAPADFTFFGKKISRKRYTSTSELWDAAIIYQSITGLYETRYYFEVD